MPRKVRASRNPLRAAITELRTDGFEPTIIFIPLSWRLLSALELELARRRGGEADPPGWVPPEERDRFVGVAEGVPVFEVVQMDEYKLALLALGSFGRWRQWTSVDDAGDLEVEIVAYDGDQARALAEENPDLFRAEGRETADARAREIQKAVRVKILERFKLEARDEAAARWLRIPEDLRRG